MGDTLYDADVLLWSERQADLLRRLARGERVNEAPDWENVAEEIESVGRSEVAAVGSHLRIAMSHLLYIHASRLRDPVAHWRGEAVAALADARRSYAPSMRQRLRLEDEWEAARAVALAKLDGMGGGPARPIPEACPWALDELLPRGVRGAPDLGALLARLDATVG